MELQAELVDSLSSDDNSDDDGEEPADLSPRELLPLLVKVLYRAATSGAAASVRTVLNATCVCRSSSKTQTRRCWKSTCWVGSPHRYACRKHRCIGCVGST